MLYDLSFREGEIDGWEMEEEGLRPLPSSPPFECLPCRDGEPGYGDDPQVQPYLLQPYQVP